jgi:hypothetical protein
MIDRVKRDHLAHRLRLLAAGQITNDQFEDSLDFRSKDRAIWRTYWDGAWPLYDDLREHKLTGKDRLTDETKREISRVILFLKSDREFEWKEIPWLVSVPVGILGFLTFGYLSRLFYRHTWGKQADTSIWPYYRQSDLEADLSKQPYLTGKS